MSDIAASIASDIQTALANDELILPSLPEVALTIREEAESEKVTAASLSFVVSQDPGLAAQLIKIANSPMFRATRSIDDLSQAISRLGVEYAATIVTGLAMQQMFQATSEMVDNKMRQTWRHSTDVAAWSSILCQQLTRLRPDQATLAGLTHAIGVLPILAWVEENDHLIHDSITLDRVIEQAHPAIGTMILQHWQFADEIVEVPAHYAATNHQADQADYIDVVSAANMLTLHDLDEEHPLLHANWSTSPAFSRLELDPSEESSQMEEMHEAVLGVKTVFS